MTPLAHISGLPAEEIVLPLAYGGGAVWLGVRAWASHALRRPGRR